MEASELRIGNYVLNENNQIVEVDATRIMFLQDGRVKYKPIEVTEEWLIKFGFINYDNDDFFTYGNLHYNTSNNRFYIGNDHASSFHDDATIKFVHQLQNLFFALTGREL